MTKRLFPWSRGLESILRVYAVCLRCCDLLASVRIAMPFWSLLAEPGDICVSLYFIVLKFKHLDASLEEVSVAWTDHRRCKFRTMSGV